MLDLINELLATEAAIDKLGARGISVDEAGQVIWNRYVVIRNRRGSAERPQRDIRRLLIGCSDSHRVLTLVIEGTIVNLTTRTLDVPRLRFALRSASGHEVYAWTAQPAKPTLGSGNGLPFRARLASPPPDGRDVIVRFLNRRDVAAGSP